eukprot:CAMPEP_0117445676 /NCGR_PEP_ID=MMETSP0759-20121206/5925_1 /TAXON_ID=63605 /ORGANISM="Percolomonas cosmopolitus, Strain WS" /LENGTH=532 /DNA_ID=CAMNT_0005237873 /DNA_START=254 /DNA_END=1852 /DNA_ORIENTATION=-
MTKQSSFTNAKYTSPEQHKNLLSFKMKQKDVERVICGSAAFAGGGGGAKKWGHLFLDQCKPDSEGVICEAISISQLQDEDTIVPVALMGSPESLNDKTSGQDQVLTPLALAARDAWGACPKNSGSMKYVISVEVGGTNSIVPMFVANASNQESVTPENKVYVIDGDLQGRAVQSLVQLGPYQNGLSTVGTCFSYIAKESGDGPLPVPPKDSTLLFKQQFTVKNPSGKSTNFWILGCACPDNVQNAAELEAYLSNLLRNHTYPKSVIAVAFGGLKCGDLMKHGESGEAICSPNTVHRSWAVGKKLIRQRQKMAGDVFLPLQQHGAYLFGTGAFQGISTAAEARSDIGRYTVRINGSRTLTCLFHNENVVLGVETPLAKSEGEYETSFEPICTAPDSINLQAINDVLNPKPTNPNDEYLVRSGDCFSNDELSAIQRHFPNGSIPLYVNVFAIPSAPLNRTTVGLDHVGPQHWHLAEGFPSVKGLSELEYIQSHTEYQEPQVRNLPQPNSPRSVDGENVMDDCSEEQPVIQKKDS